MFTFFFVFVHLAFRRHHFFFLVSSFFLFLLSKCAHKYSSRLAYVYHLSTWNFCIIFPLLITFLPIPMPERLINFNALSPSQHIHYIEIYVYAYVCLSLCKRSETQEINFNYQVHLVSYWVDTTHIIICMCVRLVGWLVCFIFAASNGVQSSIILPHLSSVYQQHGFLRTAGAPYTFHSSQFLFSKSIFNTNHLEYNIFFLSSFCCCCFLLCLSICLTIC